MSEKRSGRGTSSWQDMALEQLDALYGYAMTLTHSDAESEDLVQETYICAMQHFDRLRPDTNMKAWLFTILRNVWLKKLRRRRSGPDFVPLDEDNMGIQSVQNDPQTVLSRIWERNEVRSALRKMQRHFAEIIVLREIEEFSYKELSGVLDCPVGTVMSRLARARAKFKQVLCSQRAALAGLRIEKQ